jgi:hypothetical protein
MLTITLVGVTIVALVLIGTVNNSSLVQPAVPLDVTTKKDIMVDKTTDLAGVIAFRDRYGEPNIDVFGVVIHYQKTEAEITGVPYNGTNKMEPQVLLILDLDYDYNVRSMQFTCINDSEGFQLNENILEYLQNEYCFEYALVTNIEKSTAFVKA